MRWDHPTRGPIDPTEFVGLAEENGTILALGRAVLQTAARQVVEWHRLPGLESLQLSVNLSPLQLQQPGFIDEVVAEIHDAGIDPHDLTFEMTETAMFRDIGATIATLEALRDLGIRIAMDDFGTGYSSLAYLRRFPVDSLKIARELIAGPGRIGRSRGVGLRPRHRRVGPLARPVDRRRGHRDARATAGPARPRLRPRSGLPVRQAGRRRGDRIGADECGERADGRAGQASSAGARRPDPGAR